jgi:hypothetical protein
VSDGDTERDDDCSCDKDDDSEYVPARGAAHCNDVRPLGTIEARWQWHAQLPSISCATAVFVPKQDAAASQSEQASVDVRLEKTGPKLVVVYDAITDD